MWLASKDKNKYGKFRMPTKDLRAHRVSWVIHRGLIPEKTYVLHKCDNPSCVNPEHLFLGTNQQNMDDMNRKGRANPPKGDRHSSKTHPERVARGERHGSKTKPESVPRGENHYAIKTPWKINNFGDKNGSRTKPERVARGDRHGSVVHPEKTARGEACNSKLTESQVLEMRRLHTNEGMNFHTLGRMFSISYANASRVVRRLTWKHLP